jgi:N-acetylmuramoyl-L-alanine amidase
LVKEAEMIAAKDRSPNQQPRPTGWRPTLLVAHFTATAGWASPYGYLRNPQRLTPWKRVSAHYLIDVDGRYVQMVETDQEAWHAGASSWPGHRQKGGSLNATSIGYEMVNPNDGTPASDAQYHACAELMAHDALRYNIPIDRQHIVGHYEISPGRKTDPHKMDLDKLVRLVRMYADGLLHPTPKNEVPLPWEVEITADALNVRQGRATTYPIAGKLTKGQRVLVDDDTDGWLHLANELGFISKSYTRPV